MTANTTKTKQQKIALCTRYLEANGVTCFSQMMSAADVAKALGVSKATVRNWGNINLQGYYIPSFPKEYLLGRNVRFKAQEIAAWVETQAEPAPLREPALAPGMMEIVNRLTREAATA